MNKIKLLKTIGVLFTLSLSSIIVNANEIDTVDEENAKIVKTMVVQDGQTIIYEGEDAEEYLEQQKYQSSEVNDLWISNEEENIDIDNWNTAAFFIYDYYYDESYHVDDYYCYELETRITPKLRNTTSTEQSYSFSWESSSEVSSDVSLTSTELLKIAEFSISSGKTKTVSEGGEMTMNVPAGKTIWMTYYPIKEKTVGTLYKGLMGVVSPSNYIEKKSGVVKYPKRSYCSEIGVSAPDGVYTWKEI